MAYDCLRILGSTLDPPPLMCLQYALLFGRSVRSDTIPGPGSLVGDRAFVVSRARPRKQTVGGHKDLGHTSAVTRESEAYEFEEAGLEEVM